MGRDTEGIDLQTKQVAHELMFNTHPTEFNAGVMEFIGRH